MKEIVGFIAVGQGGGNIGSLFEKNGHNVIYINSSQSDLDTLVDAKHTHHIKDGEGCNRNRDKAKTLVIQDFDAILSEIEEKMTQEMIGVIFTSGGGTGSGAGPLLIDYIIQNTKKKVFAVTAIPSASELYKPYINSYECFTELEDIQGLGATFILDNNKDDKLELNKKFVDVFEALLDIPGYKDASGNIDRAEITEILMTRGAAVLAKMTKEYANTSSLIKMMLSEGIFAPLENDRVIKYIGMSSNVDIDANALYKEVGMLLDIFLSINPVNTTVILAGLSYPYTLLNTIRERVEGGQETVTKNITSTSKIRLTGDINFLNAETVPVSSNPHSTKEDFFAKYTKKS